MDQKAFRVEFRVTAFLKTDQAASPQRIEERITMALKQLIADPQDEDAEVFGYVSDLGVTRE